MDINLPNLRIWTSVDFQMCVSAWSCRQSFLKSRCTGEVSGSHKWVARLSGLPSLEILRLKPLWYHRVGPCDVSKTRQAKAGRQEPQEISRVVMKIFCFLPCSKWPDGPDISTPKSQEGGEEAEPGGCIYLTSWFPLEQKTHNIPSCWAKEPCHQLRMVREEVSDCKATEGPKINFPSPPVCPLSDLSPCLAEQLIVAVCM